MTTLSAAADRLRLLRLDLWSMSRGGIAAALDDLEADCRSAAEIEAARVAEGREAMEAIGEPTEGEMAAILDGADFPGQME